MLQIGQMGTKVVGGCEGLPSLAKLRLLESLTGGYRPCLRRNRETAGALEADKYKLSIPVINDLERPLTNRAGRELALGRHRELQADFSVTLNPLNSTP